MQKKRVWVSGCQAFSLYLFPRLFAEVTSLLLHYSSPIATAAAAEADPFVCRKSFRAHARPIIVMTARAGCLFFTSLLAMQSNSELLHRAFRCCCRLPICIHRLHRCYVPLLLLPLKAGICRRRRLLCVFEYRFRPLLHRPVAINTACLLSRCCRTLILFRGRKSIVALRCVELLLSGSRATASLTVAGLIEFYVYYTRSYIGAITLNAFVCFLIHSYLTSSSLFVFSGSTVKQNWAPCHVSCLRSVLYVSSKFS